MMAEQEQQIAAAASQKALGEIIGSMTAHVTSLSATVAVLQAKLQAAEAQVAALSEQPK